jgi:hypothetical protein
VAPIGEMLRRFFEEKKERKNKSTIDSFDVR